MENSSERIDRTDCDVQTAQNDVLTACSTSADPSPANAPLEGNSNADAGDCDSEGACVEAILDREWEAARFSESDTAADIHKKLAWQLAILIYEHAWAAVECKLHEDSMDETDAQLADLVERCDRLHAANADYVARCDRLHAANVDYVERCDRLHAANAESIARSKRVLAESAKLEAETAKVLRATRRPARPAHRKCHACKARALAARLIRK